VYFIAHFASKVQWPSILDVDSEGYEPRLDEDSSMLVSLRRKLSGFQIFGGVSSLNVFIASLSILIIIFAVQVVEYMFHYLHTLTTDTSFQEMMVIIEKELMGVGFTAFMFKIMVNTTSFLDLDWFHALEYAGIVISYGHSCVPQPGGDGWLILLSFLLLYYVFRYFGSNIFIFVLFFGDDFNYDKH
jgi:hypothetical protein